MACTEGQFHINELILNNQFKAFGIDLNGMTRFNQAVENWKNLMV